MANVENINSILQKHATAIKNYITVRLSNVSATTLKTARAIDGVSFNGSAAITHYGTCSTAASTVAKTVACTGYTLVTGSFILVQFTVTNTAANPTLNVNNTGAKNIVYRNSNVSAGYLSANRNYMFVYDGTNYELVGDINTTYSNMSGATANANGAAGLVPQPTAGNQEKFLKANGTWSEVDATVTSNNIKYKFGVNSDGIVYLEQL